jgi:hypothetical protein
VPNEMMIAIFETNVPDPEVYAPPGADHLVRGKDPEPSIIKQK